MTHQRPEHTHFSLEDPGGAWREEDLVAAFVEQATANAKQRRVLFDFACGLFPFEPDARIRVLDIGAGYGAFAEAVLERFPNAAAVGLDVSEPMMAAGRERMARFGDRFSYFVGDFANSELPQHLPGPFDAAVASASILHLLTDQKRRLYAGLFKALNPGGCFFNVEPVAPANEEMQAWYRERRAWQFQRGDKPALLPEHSFLQHHHFDSEEAYQQHQRHHHLETEANQLAFLRAAGFVRVDCFYKQLLETIVGAYKPA